MTRATTSRPDSGTDEGYRGAALSRARRAANLAAMKPAAAAETVEGVVERVLYRSDDDAFTVVLVRVEGRPELLKAAGPVGEVGADQLWRFAGETEDHPRYGRRLKILTAFPVTPSTLEGLRRYLSSGRFPGVGEKTAAKKIENYG
jgi:exodeoxyribonuclease V alpha subunit